MNVEQARINGQYRLLKADYQPWTPTDNIAGAIFLICYLIPLASFRAIRTKVHTARRSRNH